MRRRQLSAAALLLLLVGSGTLAWFSWHQRQASLCTGAAERLLGVWDVPRQKAIEKAFLATQRSYAHDTWQRVYDALDTYTIAWRNMHQSTCEATRLRGEQSEAVLSLRMACLDNRLQDVAALTEVFTEADATVVEKAISATSALRGLEGCADVEALMADVPPPEDQATRQSVDTARAQLARVKALTEAGKFKHAQKLAKDVAEKAADFHYPPLYAEALFMQGWTQLIAGENQGVPALLQRALWLAHASRNDRVVVAASVRLMGYHSAHGPPEEARHWEQFAGAWLDRLGENGELRAIFHNNRGLALYQEGSFAEAYEAFDKAFALAEHSLGTANAMTLRYATNSVAALGNLDRIDETQRAFEMLVHLGETNLGPLHPFLGQPLSNLSNFYAFQGRFADARQLLDRVRVIGQQAYGARSEEWAQFHISYGDLEAAEGHDTEALGHYEEAAHLFRELMGAESLELMQALVKEADARTELGQLAPAQRTYQQVLEFTKKDPRQYAQVHTQVLAGLADLNDARGQHEQALHLRQQALELRERDLGPEHIHTALMRLAIASSYLELGEPARALALYDKEQAFFEKMLGADSPSGVLPLAGKGAALQQLGRAAEALPLLERVLRIIETHPMRPAYTAAVQAALARSLWDTQQQPERAWKLAMAAHATYSRSPIRHANELVRLDKLLKQQGSGITTHSSAEQ
ncbi:tetratricopeptide repeat protein [Cystobacter fuscus]|uniref:tetratricopeptide repeat protein n=1 Tax=Cystobacter fuscus TaxID=43 RepID=UPI00068694A0|nr:tetratricopeptide repeat protein [Cystobacter fuscus]